MPVLDHGNMKDCAGFKKVEGVGRCMEAHKPKQRLEGIRKNNSATLALGQRDPLNNHVRIEFFNAINSIETLVMESYYLKLPSPRDSLAQLMLHCFTMLFGPPPVVFNAADPSLFSTRGTSLGLCSLTSHQVYITTNLKSLSRS